MEQQTTLSLPPKSIPYATDPVDARLCRLERNLSFWRIIGVAACTLLVVALYVIGQECVTYLRMTGH